MIEQERTREELRERGTGDAAAGFGGAGQVDYFNVMDDVISSTISSDSEAFIQQMQQQNGQ